MSTKSLLLATVAYVCAGLAAGGLLATGTVYGSRNVSTAHVVASPAMPVPNSEAKQDRLPVFKVASAVGTVQFPSLSTSVDPGPINTGTLSGETMTMALAAEPPPQQTKIGPPAPFVSAPPAATPKPKTQAKRQSGYSLLSDEQIASIRERMKLTPSQQTHWPAIEAALRKIATKLHRGGNAGGVETAAAIDPDSPEVQDLKTAAFPLLFTLTEDQKREVRTLARVIGLNAVAEAI